MKTTIATVRKHSTCNGIRAGVNDGEPIFYGFGDFGTYEHRAHRIADIGHVGWHTNDDGTTSRDGSGLAIGVVAEFPSRPGFPDGWFLAGYLWGDIGERVYWPEVFADRDDAAHCADSHAERFAESQREDNARFEAMKDAESEEEDASANLAKLYPARNVSEARRADVRELVQALREARDTLKEKTEAYERGAE